MTRAPLALAALAALLAAAPARAQVGNQTDIPIVPPPGAGSPLGPEARLERELWRTPGTYRSARVGCAIRRAVEAHRDSVARVGVTGAAARIEAYLASGAERPVVAAALARGTVPASPGGRLAEALADALDALFRLPEGCGDDRDDYPEAARWNEAVRAYVRYLDRAPDAVFAPPSPELLAVHAALDDVLGRAVRELRGRR